MGEASIEHATERVNQREVETSEEADRETSPD